MQKHSFWESIRESLGFGNHKKVRKKDCCSAKCGQGRSFRFEPLEERALLSVCTWDGGGSDNKWSTAANWANDVAPVANDSLVFSGSTRTATTNDFTEGTSFALIEFSGSNFSLAGNALTLTNGITVDAGVTDSVISANVTMGGTLIINVVESESLSLSGILSGNNPLTKAGAGTLVLSAVNTYTGETAIHNGTLAISGGNDRLPTTTAVTLGFGGDSGVLQLGNGTTSYHQTLAGLATLGTGGSNRVVGGGSTNATLTLNISDTDTFNGILGGPGANQNNLTVTKLGAGLLTLNGTNTYSGGTTINNGTVEAKSINAIPGYNIAGRVVVNSGGAFGVNVGGTGEWSAANIQTLLSNATFSSGSSLGFDTTSATAPFVYEYPISGSFGLTKLGVGTLTLSGSNTYTGITRISQGTLSVNNIASGGNLGSATTSIVLGDGSHQGVFAYIGNNASFTRGFTVNAGGGEIDAVTSGKTLTIATGSVSDGGMLTIGGAGNTSISSTIAGTGSLRKTGAGTLTLSGTNTYSGGSTFETGTLNLTGTLTNTNSTISLGSTGTWNLAGTIIGGTVTADGGAEMRLQSSAYGILDGVTLDANLTYLGAAYLTVKNGLTLNSTISMLIASSTITFLGSQNLIGTGQINIAGNTATTAVCVQGISSLPATLTVGSGVTIRGKGIISPKYTGDNIVNQGTIIGDSSAGTLRFSLPLSNSGTLRTSGTGSLTVSNLQTNDGTIQAGTNSSDTGTLALGGNWSNVGSLIAYAGNMNLGGTWSNNTGTITVNGGALNLGGAFTTSGVGTFNYTAGTVNLTGTLTNTGSTLNLGSNTGVWTLTGSILGGVVAAGSGTWLRASGANCVLDGVTLDANMASLSGSTLTVKNGLALNGTLTLPNSSAATLVDFQGTQSLTGTGQIYLRNTSNVVYAMGIDSSTPATLTVGSGITIHGTGSIGGYYTNDIFVNGGTILADTGALTLTNNWSNTSGTLQVNGGTLNLGGTFPTAGIGTFAYTTGTVNLTGTLTNTNSTLNLNTNTGSWNLAGTIIGGTVTADGGAEMRLQSSAYGILDGVTLDANLTYLGAAYLTVKNGLTLNSTISMLIASSTITFLGSQNLIGTGQINIAGNTATTAVCVQGISSLPATLTVGSGVTIRGKGIISPKYTGDNIVNQGTIIGDSSAGTLRFSLPLSNSGTLRTSGTGSLTVSNLQTNDGTIQAGTNSSDTGTLALGGNWSNVGSLIAYAGNMNLGGTWSNNTGTITVNGGALNLGGAFTTSGVGTFNYTAGTVNLTGTLTNTGSTLNLGSNTGVWTLTGSILGGVVAAGSGTWLRASGANCVLDGVTLDANMASLSGSTLTVKNGLALNGTLTLPNSSAATLVDFQGTQSLTGTGQIYLRNTSNVVYAMGIDSSTPATLTVGSGITIHGTGSIGGYYTNDIFVNGGTILADTGALTLTNNWSNTSGTLQVNGGTLNLGGTFPTAGIGTFAYTTGTVNLTGTLTNTNSTLNLNTNTGSWNLAGTIIGGTVTADGGAEMRLQSSAYGILDGVTLDANLTYLGAAYLTVKNGLTLNSTISMLIASSTITFLGSQNLIGTGQINIAGNTATTAVCVQGISSLPATLTVGSGVTIRGKGIISPKYTGDNIVNQGTIIGDSSAGTLRFSLPLSNSGTLRTSGTGSLTVSNLQTNDGTIQAGTNSSDTGTLALGGNWSNVGSLIAYAGNMNLGGTWSNNTGTITVNGGALNLGGAFTTSGVGTFNYTAGTVNLTGTLTNTGSTLNLGSNTGVWTLTGSILGGVVAAGSGTWLRASGANCVLDGVTLDANMASLSGSTLTVKNGLALNGTLTLPNSSAATLVDFQGTQSLTGTGQIYLRNTSNVVYAMGIDSSTPATLTVGSGITIHGTGSIGGYYTNDIFVNGGTILADTGALTLTNNWSNTSGTLQVNGGTLNLGGTFPTAGIGTFAYTTGTVNLTGTLTNTNSTLNLNTNTGSWNLAGTIIGGTVTADGGAEMRLQSGESTLDGVTLDANLIYLSAAHLTVKNGLTLNGTISLPQRASASVTFSGTQNLTGTGEIVLMDSNSVAVAGASSSSPATLTVGSGVTLRGEGFIRGTYTGDNLVNQGTILGDSVSDTLTVRLPLTNSGMLRTSGTGMLTIDNLQTNTGAIQAGTFPTDTGTLTLAGEWTNTGTFLAKGSAVLNTGSAVISGTIEPVSGTELRLMWNTFDPGTTYSIELSSDGVTYSSITDIESTDNGAIVGGLLPNESCYLRIAVTNADGGREIYDSSLTTTLDLPDASGWYQIGSVTLDSDGSELTSGFSLNTSAIYAGSKLGASLQSVQGLITDGTVPEVTSSGEVKVYQVITRGADAAMLATSSSSLSAAAGPRALASSDGDSVFTGDPSQYPNSGSVFHSFIAYTLNFVSSSLLTSGRNQDYSDDPIHYSDGMVDYQVTDLTSINSATGLSHKLSWSNNNQLSVNNRNGSGWIDESLPTIQRTNGNSAITVVFSGTNTVTFKLMNSQYVPTTYVSDALINDAVNHEVIWSDIEGNQIHFYDFSSSTPAGRRGTFKSRISAGGVQSYVSSWTASDAIQEVRCQNASGNDIESWLYSYLPDTDVNAGLVSGIQLCQPDGQGGWTVVQSVEYDYYDEVAYDGSDPSVNKYQGNPHDLKTVSIKDQAGNVLSVNYFCYYGERRPTGIVVPDHYVCPINSIGGSSLGRVVYHGGSDYSGAYPGGLKYVFDDASFQRLSAAVADPFAVDANLAPYAQQYFKYDLSYRCTQHDIQATGNAASQGVGTFTYAYYDNPSLTGNAANNNTWQYKTVETLPDGNQNIIYCNRMGEVMLKVFNDIADPANPALSSQQWLSFYKYDDQGRPILEASSSAITGYDESNGGLLVSINGNYQYLADNAGSIFTTEYYTTTTASATVAGGVAGYVYQTKVQEGELGTPILQESKSYFKKSSNGRTNVIVASDTVYRNTDGTGAATTSYAYTWFANTVGIQSIVESLPAVSDQLNGTGSSDTLTVFCNRYGQPIWTKDADGYIAYIEYDDITRAAVKIINDVNTANTSNFTDLPAGWATIAGAGLDLTTTREVDALGRTVKQTDPNGSITYIVYDDVNREVRTYAGWNSTTHNITGAITLYRKDIDGNYTETISYVWNDAAGVPVDASNRPTGAESLTDSRTAIQSLSRSLMNSAGQVVQILQYIDLTGLTYSTARTFGAKNVNYFEIDYTYGFWGNRTGVTDALGNTTTYAHAANGWLDHVTDDLGNVTRYAYDADGNVIGVTDALGNTTAYDYDLLGRCISVTDALNHTATSVYDNVGNLLSTTDARGNVTTKVYDARGRLYTVTDDLGNTTSYTYDARDHVVAVTDDLGNTTNYTYNGHGKLASVTDALSHTTNYGYDDCGNLTMETDALNNATAYAYDDLSRRISATDDLGNVTTYAYDAMGNLVSVTDDLGVVTRYTYDLLGRRTQTIENYVDGVYSSAAPDEDIVTAYAYDAVGNLLSTTDALGNTTEYSYDDLGRRTSMTDALDNVTEYTYDDVGNLLTVTDPLDHVTTYAYDDLGQLLTATDAEGGVITYTYDANGNLLTLTDAEGNTTAYEYDELNRIVEETNESNLTRYYVYNDVGLLVQMTDFNGRVTTYEYDDVYRETEENWLDSSQNVIYTCQSTYDAVGQRVSVQDAAAIYEYEHDDLGRIVEETQTFPDSPTIVLTYDYDDLGRVTETACTVGGTADYVIEYTYDDLGRATSIAQHGLTGGNAVAEKRIDLTYDADGQYATITYYSDLDGGASNLVMTATYAYDDVGQLTGLVYTDASSATIRSFAWTYDDAGRATSHDSDVAAEDVTAYTYDATGQLLTTDYAANTDESYTYDDNGNRMTGNGDTYATGVENQTTGDGTHRYLYDSEGNLVARYVDEDTDGLLDVGDTDVTVYTWDYRNRLTNVSHYSEAGGAASMSVDYVYDAYNRRIVRALDADGAGTGGSATEHYVWDDEKVALDFVDADGAGEVSSPELATRYLWGQAVDQLFAQEAVDDGGPEDVSYPVIDNLHSVRSLVDSAGDITATYRYDSYGNATALAGSLAATRFLYTSQEYDAATGLYYYNVRWYNPALGKFVSVDPSGFNAGDANLYRYVGNGPTNYVDPSGLCGQSRDWLDLYANCFNKIFGSWWSKTAGSTIYETLTDSGLASNDQLSDMSAWEALGWTTAVSVPTGIGLFLGGEALLGVGEGAALFNSFGYWAGAQWYSSAALATSPWTGAALVAGGVYAATNDLEASLQAGLIVLLMFPERATSNLAGWFGKTQAANAPSEAESFAPARPTSPSTPGYWWSGRYSTPASQHGSYQASGGRVFPTLRNSGLKGAELRAEQEAFTAGRLMEGNPVEIVRGQAGEAGLTVFGWNERLADRGAENAIQRAINVYQSTGVKKGQ